MRTWLVLLFCLPALAEHSLLGDRFKCDPKEYQELLQSLEALKESKSVDKKALLERLKKGSSACLSPDLLDGLENALTEAGLFPCDVTKFPASKKDKARKARLRLHGERHTLCELCAKRREKLDKALPEGTALLAREGLSYDRASKESQRGFEDPFIFGMSAVFLDRYAVYQFDANPDSRPHLEDAFVSTFKFLRRIDSNPEVKKVWKAVERPLRSIDGEAVAVLVDEFLGLKREKQTEFLTANLETLIKAKRNGTLRVMDALGSMFHLKSQLNPSRYRAPNDATAVQLMARVMLKGSDTKIFDEFQKIFAVKWRDESMANNLAKVFCHAALDGMDVDAVFGFEHTPGITDRLETMWKNSGGGDPNPFIVDKEVFTHAHVLTAPVGSEAAKVSAWFSARSPKAK